MEEIIKTFKEKQDSIPKNLKIYIKESGWDKKILEISRAVELNNKQEQRLILEVAMVLHGISHIADFIDSIEEGLLIDSEKSESIFYEVNQEIFQPAIDLIGEMYSRMLIAEGEVPPPEEKEFWDSVSYSKEETPVEHREPPKPPRPEQSTPTSLEEKVKSTHTENSSVNIEKSEETPVQNSNPQTLREKINSEESSKNSMDRESILREIEDSRFQNNDTETLKNSSHSKHGDSYPDGDPYRVPAE